MVTRESRDETLDVFAGRDAPGVPLTTSEVAEELDCARRTAYSKLEALAEEGRLETKKVGARGRIWWRPVEASPSGATAARQGLAHAQFRELAEAVTNYAIFVLDTDGTVQTWNDGAKQIKGYDRDDIVGEHFSTFYTESDREDGRPDANLAAAVEDGRTEDEGWRVREDGSKFWSSVTITAVRDEDEALQGFIKITRDLTERHAAEEQLRREKERFETLVREVKDYAIFLLDADGTVRTWNEGARRLKGYDRDDIVGEHFSAFYTESDREDGRPDANLAAAVEDGRTEDEGWRVREDGTRFWANVTITALSDDDGEVRGFAKVTRDMTERHDYEERLRTQRDELDELDQINAVIRDIDQALVTATSREEIEQAVCDRLAASDTYAAAWTAEYTPDYEEITPRTAAGISEEYLEAVRAADDDSETTERGVGADALRSQTIQSVQELQSDRDGEPWRAASVEAGFESAITVPLVYSETEYGVLTVYADDESAFDQRKITVIKELSETVSHAITAIERKEREQTLTALHASTRELLHTDDHGEIGDVIVDTLTGDLALDDAAVYHFDTTENVLDPVSSSFQADAASGRLTALSAGADSPIWTSFVESEPRVSASVLPSRNVGDRRTMVVPLGDYGVLAVAAPAQELSDESTRNLVELVAATAEAGFDRVESQANLRERDELLQDQNQRLQRLNQINTIIREVDQGLVRATSRDEVERVVCDRLTTSDRFRFAWVGRLDEFDDGLAPQAWEGDGRGYLDSVDLTLDQRVGGADPGVETARTAEVTVVSNVAENLRGGRWRREAFSREFQSAISVPLTYGDVDVTYGVLTVYGDRPDAFNEMERSVFAELGRTIANAIDAIDTKRALVGDQSVELEFHLQDDSTSFLARLGRQLETGIDFEGAIPLSERRVRTFFLARDVAQAAIRDALDRSVVVESHRIVDARDEGHLVEAVVSGRTIPGSLLEHGASLRTLTVTDDGVRLLVDVSSRRDIREFIERFRSRFEGAELVAHRQRDRPVQTPEQTYVALEERLTDRQLEVLETAYYSGFFASPRRSTGGDVADLLDVSQPTITEQLRTAQCTLLDLVVGEDRTDA